MAPPWVKGPRQGPATVMSSPQCPWGNNAPSNGNVQLLSFSPLSEGPAFAPSQILPPIAQSQPQNYGISPKMPVNPVAQAQAQPQNYGISPKMPNAETPTRNPGLPRPNLPPTSVMPKSPESPKSLGALLQMAPLRAPTPSINESSESVPAQLTPSTSQAKPGLKGPIAPNPAGPLAGAKFVLPPIPPRPVLKVVSGKNANHLAKIAQLRQSIRPRPDDIGNLLREIEGGKRLNHVPCDDRSKPLIRRCQTFYSEF